MGQETWATRRRRRTRRSGYKEALTALHALLSITRGERGRLFNDDCDDDDDDDDDDDNNAGPLSQVKGRMKGERQRKTDNKAKQTRCVGRRSHLASIKSIQLPTRKATQSVQRDVPVSDSVYSYSRTAFRLYRGHAISRPSTTPSRLVQM